MEPAIGVRQVPQMRVGIDGSSRIHGDSGCESHSYTNVRYPLSVSETVNGSLVLHREEPCCREANTR